MANIQTLKSDIQTNIGPNGQGDITALVLQDQLLDIADAIDDVQSNASSVHVGSQPPASGNLWIDTSDNSNDVDTTPTENSDNLITSGGVYSAIASIPAPAPEIFWATYGATTATEIQTALDAGKIVMCRYTSTGECVYRLDFSGSTNFEFHAISSTNYIYRLYVNKSTNAWGIESSGQLQKRNIIASTSSTDPSDSNYYSALATKNLVDAVDTKIGSAVSLTFTYDDDTTATYNLLTAPSNNS